MLSPDLYFFSKHQGPFYYYKLTLISAWISSHTLSSAGGHQRSRVGLSGWQAVVLCATMMVSVDRRHCGRLPKCPGFVSVKRYGAIVNIAGNGRAASYSPWSLWGQDKMAAILQMAFSNTFSWMKIFEFQLRFHWSLFPRVQLTICQHWFR